MIKPKSKQNITRYFNQGLVKGLWRLCNTFELIFRALPEIKVREVMIADEKPRSKSWLILISHAFINFKQLKILNQN